MPSFVVKPVQSEDFYVYWSTVVDAPVGYGSRAEMLQERDVTPERLDRADARGTSMIEGSWFDWDDHELLLQNVDFKGQREDCAYFIPRAKLKELCERMERGEDVGDLLRMESPATPDEVKP